MKVQWFKVHSKARSRLSPTHQSQRRGWLPCLRCGDSVPTCSGENFFWIQEATANC